MKHTNRISRWIRNFLAIAILGFVLNFPSLGGSRAVHAQEPGEQAANLGLSWEYQVDFNATSWLSAKQQADRVAPSINLQGIDSELQSLGGSLYRLRLTGEGDMEKMREAIYSPLLPGFISGAGEIEINMPVGSLLNIPLKLESNLTTGYIWEVAPSLGTSFTQVGETTFTARSSGYGVPSVQTLMLKPEALGSGVINLVYHRPFETDETITRHLQITLAAQVLEIDLSDPHPTSINTQADPLPSLNAPNPIDEIPAARSLPAAWDWRTYGIVPAVRNQGACGGCWSFGTAGVMESAIVKAGGLMTDLSEQFLISCNTAGWSCSGGWTGHKWHYDTLGLNQYAIGAVLEADKPYTASNGTCNAALSHPYILSGWQFIAGDDFSMPTVDQIKNAIYTYGPVTAGVCTDSGWTGYTGGVYNPSTNECDGYTNHQIILVGWEDATSSWIMRNSWGSSWGESGYMRIGWDTNGTKSRVGEGTSWVSWEGSGPAPFSKSSPANGSSGQPGNPVLRWATSSEANSYEYCIDTSSNSTCNTSWISTGTSTSVQLSGRTPGIYSWQVRAVNGSGTTDANDGAWWSFTVGQSSNSYYLPLIYKRYPPVPDAPVLNPINNPDGSKYYSVSWNTAYLADDYVLQEDDNLSFSSPSSVYDGYSTSWYASGKAAGTYYYRVTAYNEWGGSGWSNVQATTVLPPMSNVYVVNDTGCKVCYEVKDTGIGKKCFTAAGSNYYGSFPAGTYNYSASACCGSASGSKSYGAGTYEHRFWCIGSQNSGDRSSGLQCEMDLEPVSWPDGK